jgi:hypothetical protein
MNQLEELITRQGILDVVHPNMAQLSDEDNAAFAMVRRSGLGASDSSVYLGVNQWTSIDQLIEEKKSIGYTAHEKEVSEKENVRKGKDLEPIILGKFAKQMRIEVIKPTPMYRIIEHPQLTINFDGVCMMGDQPIPVEAKFASAWADKYWNKGKWVRDLFEGKPMLAGGGTLIEHIELEGELYGIPPYYYTQVQQQMLGLNAPFGYFAVIFDKGWQFGAYKIYKDQYVQDAIISESAKVWKRVKPS